MNSLFIAIVFIPALEIYLLIKIGSQIGAVTTLFLIFATAILGIYYAKYEGLNTLRAGFNQLRKNEAPTYEMLSGATIAFAALILILPGFFTDLLGFLLIFPLSRRIILNSILKKFRNLKNETNIIDGEYQDIDENNDRKF